MRYPTIHRFGKLARILSVAPLILAMVAGALSAFAGPNDTGSISGHVTTNPGGLPIQSVW